MKEEQIKKIVEFVKEKDEDHDLNDYVNNHLDEEDLKEIEDIDELKDYLTELDENGYITRAEVIYYSNAIEILKENDNSLRESLDLADEFGYSLKDINSEILASLLKTKLNEEDFYELVDEVIEFCDEWDLTNSEKENE